MVRRRRRAPTRSSESPESPSRPGASSRRRQRAAALQKVVFRLAAAGDAGAVGAHLCGARDSEVAALAAARGERGRSVLHVAAAAPGGTGTCRALLGRVGLRPLLAARDAAAQTPAQCAHAQGHFACAHGLQRAVGPCSAALTPLQRRIAQELQLEWGPAAALCPYCVDGIDPSTEALLNSWLSRGSSLAAAAELERRCAAQVAERVTAQRRKAARRQGAESATRAQPGKGGDAEGCQPLKRRRVCESEAAIAADNDTRLQDWLQADGSEGPPPWPRLLHSGGLPLPPDAQIDAAARRTYAAGLWRVWHPDKLQPRLAHLAEAERRAALARCSELIGQIAQLRSEQ
eukprot:TRINITY_DN15151_c0_g1_i1.p1 TRINITY_DN15151_c0_g1~~TRINITY_DN15151_c0_g1_i1.p1  ORF type:complete len:346 (+),score=84.14 TRINITY_DN15151_c0_g1_i1:72-1109(+)